MDQRCADERDLPEVGSHVRIVGDVSEADFLICENGFYSLLVCDNMAVIETVPEAFDAIGAKVVADAIRQIFATIPESVISSPLKTRFTLLDELRRP